MSRIYLYDVQDIYAIRSFIIVIYDRNGNELKDYHIPVSVAAPFANRLFREIPDIRGISPREPWYELVPGDDLSFRRSPLPPGPTSLYGQPYNPGADMDLMMHPDARVRYFVVRLLDFQTELYKGIYTVDDIFLHGTHYLLNNGIRKGQLPNGKGPYQYAIVPSPEAVYSVSADILPEDAYQVEGVFRLPPKVRDEPRIRFRPVPEPPLPEHDPAAFEPVQTYGKGDIRPGRIFIPSHIYHELRQGLKLSQTVEEGGGDISWGNVYREPGSPGKEDDPDFRWMVEVTDLLMAEGTVGSPAMLLFTGDSWSRISRRRAKDYADRKLVGWFHTHTFPATDDFGLSGLDQDMHAWYLPKPWQIAILLNIERNGDRTVRCYQRGPKGDLAETSFGVRGEKVP